MKKLFSKRGMTYVEMLVALALLSLIVVSFTPMLLSSYETIYNAGEKIQKNYNSREEIEEGLARRDKTNVVDMNLDLRVNADILFNQINVNGRKIVSTFESAFETVFGQVRPRLEIVSRNTVYDDQPSHDMMLQTIGMTYDYIEFGRFSDKYTIDDNGESALPEDTIFIQVTMPDKTKGDVDNEGKDADTGSSTEEAVYDAGTILNVSLASEDSDNFQSTSGTIEYSDKLNNGRFKLRVGKDNLDFTYSPLQVKAYYVNPRGKTRTAADYLYIEPASMIFAGETSGSIDYYTSPGVEEIDTSTSPTNKTSEFKLVATSRQMRTSNSPFLNNQGKYHTKAAGAPGDYKVNSKGQTIRINAVKWIDNDESAGIDPYYVMVGTDGAIYRMYNFTSNKTDLYEYATGHKIYDTSSGYFGGGQPYIDNIYNISNGARIYPSFWGGDTTHIFEYSSARRRVGYGPSVNNHPGVFSLKDGITDSDETWVTSARAKVYYDDKSADSDRAGLTGDPKYNVMSPKAQYVYYYNGDGTGHDMPTKNMRTISYILTERGKPLRLFGIIKEGGVLNGSQDAFRAFYDIWDRSNTIPESDGKNLCYDEQETSSTKHGWMNQIYAFYYPDSNDATQNDYTLSSIRLKSLASYDLKLTTGDGMDNYFDTANDNHFTTSMLKTPNLAGSDRLGGQSYDINISDIAYIPGTDSTLGSTFYVGSVAAFANVVQTNKVSEQHAYQNDKHKLSDDGVYRNLQEWWTNKNSYPRGVVTDYLIFTDDNSDATYVVKYDDSESNVGLNTNGWDRDGADTRKNQLDFCTDYVRNNCIDIHGASTERIKELGLDDGSIPAVRSEFFFPSLDCTWKYLYLEDTKFTLGFSSNREKVYTNITYDGTTEFVRSFERLYWRSHYGQDAYGASAQTAFSGSTLNVHTQQRMICTGEGKIKNDETYGYSYLNSTENDYYNVWFPGEMYNLTKVASKDGVTVAVGYSVAGSVYQYINPGASTRTSTALGGIYNDGVLSAMVEGEDDALVNLLYFKDNETFDGTSYNDKKFYTSGDDTYGTYSSYGTHARDSVQFVAVDLIVESQSSVSQLGQKSRIDYYAYYGDNKGRVFRSLVATGTGTASQAVDAQGKPIVDENGEPVVNVDKTIELVPFIKDKTSKVSGTYYGQSVNPNTIDKIGGLDKVEYSYMEEIKVTDSQNIKHSLSDYFSKIGTIDAKDDMVIITGEAKVVGDIEIIVVGLKDSDTGVWTYRAVKNGSFTGIINDAAIVGGYYYIVGKGGGTSKPWVAAVPLDTLRIAAQYDAPDAETTIENYTEIQKIFGSGGIPTAPGNVSTNRYQLLWIETDVELYAIAGRDTK